MPNASRPRIAAGLGRRARRRRRATTGRRFMERAAAIWDLTRGPFLESPLDGVRARSPGWRAASATSRTVAPWRTLRGLGPAVPARPAPAHAASTATPPTPAPTRAGRPPRWPPCRTSSRPSAPGTSPAGCAGSATPLREPRRRARGARVRTGADVAAVLLDGGRAAGVELADGEELPADVVVADADAAHLYADLLPPAPRGAGPAGCAGPRRRCPGSCCCWRCAAARPGCATTPCCSRRTTTTSSTRCSAPAGTAAGRGRCPTRRVYVSAPDDPALPPGRRPRGLVRAGQRAAGTTRDAGVDWDVPGLAERYADRMLARAGPARARRPRPGCCGGRSARRPTWSATPRSAGGSIYGTQQQRRRGRRSCARPTARRSPGCSWSAARRTPAAGCRWSGCPPRSSPSSSAAPEPAVSAGGGGPRPPAGSGRRARRRARRRRRPAPSRRPRTGTPRRRAGTSPR